MELINKICSKCLKEKPINNFYNDKNGKYGVRGDCKDCTANRHAENYKNNSEHIKQRNVKWKIKIKEEKTIAFWNLRARKVNERAKSKQISDKIHGIGLLNLYNLSEGKCGYCNLELDLDNFHVDHIIPLSKNGQNNINNITLSCPICNLHKSDKIFNEYDYFKQIEKIYFNLLNKYNKENTEGRLI